MQYVVPAELQLLMNRSEALSCAASYFHFTEFSLRENYCHCTERRAFLCGQRDKRGRINAAAQKDPNRNVRNQMGLYSFLKQRPQKLSCRPAFWSFGREG